MVSIETAARLAATAAQCRSRSLGIPKVRRVASMSFIPEIESGAAPRVGRSKVAAVSSGWAQFALAVGGFGIGTGEFAIMGLLPQVAGDFGVSVPAAGHVISAYALGVVIGAPLISVIAARWPRRRLLLILMACCRPSPLGCTQYA